MSMHTVPTSRLRRQAHGSGARDSPLPGIPAGRWLSQNIPYHVTGIAADSHTDLSRGHSSGTPPGHTLPAPIENPVQVLLAATPLFSSARLSCCTSARRSSEKKRANISTTHEDGAARERKRGLLLLDHSHYHAPFLGVELHQVGADVDRNDLERTGLIPPHAGCTADHIFLKDVDLRSRKHLWQQRVQQNSCQKKNRSEKTRGGGRGDRPKTNTSM